MDGVVTVLDPQNYAQVISLWQALKVHCDVPDIKNHFLPHFSWHVAETYNCGLLNKSLEEISARCQPFVVQTAGLGIFPGEKPVVYISLVKNRQLLELHELLWDEITPLAVRPSLYYAPSNWVPHVTIFFDELYNPLPTGWQSKDSMVCVINYLVGINLNLIISANNFAYACMDADQMSFKHYQFGV